MTSTKPDEPGREWHGPPPGAGSQRSAGGSFERQARCPCERGSGGGQGGVGQQTPGPHLQWERDFDLIELFFVCRAAEAG